jgi:hypothetical protein
MENDNHNKVEILDLDENSMELIQDIPPSTPEFNDLKRDNTVLCNTPQDSKKIKIEVSEIELFEEKWKPDPEYINVGELNPNLKYRTNEVFTDFGEDEELNVAMKYYTVLKGTTRYDINEGTWKCWRKNPGIGKYFKEYVRSSPLKMALVQVINERVELAKIHKYEIKKNSQEEMYGILKYVKKPKVLPWELQDLEGKPAEFIKFKGDCHAKRIGFLKFYLQKNYGIDYDKFKSYNDVKWFIKNNEELFNKKG